MKGKLLLVGVSIFLFLGLLSRFMEQPSRGEAFIYLVGVSAQIACFGWLFLEQARRCREIEENQS